MKQQNSFLQFNPVVIMIFYMGVFILSILIRHPLFVIIDLIGASLYYFWLKGIKGTGFFMGLMAITFLVTIINPLLSTSGNTVLFRIFDRPYTLEALMFGAIGGVTFFSTLLWCSTYSAIITGDMLTYVSGGRLPGMTLMFVIILRFLPLYRRRIEDTENARYGIGMDSKGIERGMLNISILACGALEDGITTADSMRSRGYGQGKGTHFKMYRFALRDKILMSLLCIAIVGLLSLILCGKIKAYIYPELQLSQGAFTIAGAVIFALLINIPVIINIMEEIRWRYTQSKI